MSLELFCKKCNQKRYVGRKLCRQCNLDRLKASAKNRPRYMFLLTCKACSTEFKGYRKTTELCTSCYALKQELKALSKATNNYLYTNIPGKTVHRSIAEQLLNRKLHYNEVVHHIDHNPKNNLVNNLLVMNRKDHAKLHNFIDLQRVILEKSKNENFENCWNNLIAHLTTTWLETSGVIVIKLSEIGQPAAELLMDNTNEEGSETMHEASETGKAVDEDIVQTTTIRIGYGNIE